jgi:hypothetical protein
MRRPNFLLLCLFLCALPGIAQFDTGAILGTVTDQHGASLANTQITLEDVNRGTKISVITAADGSYQFPSASISRYRITTKHAGFGIQTSQIFALTIDARQLRELFVVFGSSRAR